MPSSLKSKLNALSSGAPAAPKPAAGPALMEYVSRVPADGALFSLSGEGLRRMRFDAPFDPRRALFLDTETTGLSGGAGTVAFLVGLGRVEGDRFAVYQYLMPNYGAEPLLLEKVAALVREAEALVTFNGRSFDVPLLRSRFVMCRMEDPTRDMPHLDLIHPARRAWKLRLKDCSLGHIEESVLGIRRENDIPGSEVPERYFSFLKSGDMSLLEDIVSHNRQDIVSLEALLARLSRAYAAPLEQTSMLDVFSLGKALEKQGERAEAGACYRLAARERPLSAMARLRERHVAGSANQRLSLMLRAGRDWGEAERVWREMIDRRQMGVFPYVELAKLYEHRAGDPREALRLTEAALALATAEERGALERRRIRLLACVAAREKREKQRNKTTEA
ncbi:MAG: ribonuclease H-like domain-containing protein [Clostridia bacterium]|nr:ribonuclease H-like domain-containing protein [Clostridia bacterium]